jgi:hypothetical protein
LLWDQVQSSTIRKKLDATKPEFKVIISSILVANTTPNQQTSGARNATIHKRTDFNIWHYVAGEKN